MFGYLNFHSHYSLLRGVTNIDDALQCAKENGCDALAMTDTNNMYGAIRFYKAAQEAGIKPILGVSLHLKHGSDKQLYKILLLAKNETGYKNILQITTVANSDMGNTTSVSLNQLEKFAEGVIAILPPENNPLQRALRSGQTREAELILPLYKKIFQDTIYLGISPQDFTPHSQETSDENQTAQILQHAQANNVKCIPLPLIYIVREDDAQVRQTLLKIQRTSLSEIEEDVFKDTLLFPPRTDIEQWCNEVHPEALANLSNLITEVTLELKLGDWIFPAPPTTDGEDSVTVLQRHIEEGLVRRQIEKTSEVEERIRFELETINGRGYTDYFLIVIDLVQYMHSVGILTTTRGSAAGSLVSYLTGITSVNPLTYKIPFERFLNPFRPSPPDIDLDIADDRRAEVLDYITQRYGKDKVAQIGTLGKLLARAAIRDTARALGYSYISGDRIARLIPFGMQGAPVYIDDAMESVPELQRLYETDDTTKHILDISRKIEGNPRHNSVHAAGVVITPTTITDYTPLEQDSKTTRVKLVTQYDMYALEDVGVLKFDILGIAYLSILANAIALIKKDKGITVDIENPPESPEVYEMISSGNTTGVFQLGGAGMTAVLKKLQPASLYDIAAVIALYRPGPMGNIDEYVARKQGRKPITFFHKKMEAFLKESYGVLVYQDDLLYTAIELAGYNWKEVDVFRKAVGKKIPKLMAEQELVFKRRVAKNTELSTSAINAIWDLFDPFKGYGFNKAHAMCYAKLSYQTAYVKKFYPVQYMVAHLRAVVGNTEDVNNSVYEVRKMGIKIHPPSINNSEVSFSTEKDEKGAESIRIGLSSIKQVGVKIAELIVDEREANGPFLSLVDFLSRLSETPLLNKKSLEGLIKVGAFDGMEERNTLLENIEVITRSLREMKTSSGQGSLFDQQIAPPLSIQLQQPKNSISPLQEFFWERELMGMYASGHPLALFSGDAALTVADVIGKTKGSRVRILGVIGAMKHFRTKTGSKACFLTLEDSTNHKIEAACFDNVVDQYEEDLGMYRIVYISGEVGERNGEKFISVNSIENPVLNIA